VTADSAESTAESAPASNAIDGNPATYWHSQYKPAAVNLPHWLTIDMHTATWFDGLVYLPRSVTSRNGNIGQYQITVSNDGTNWSTPVLTGTFADDSFQKTVTFTPVKARYVRLTALSEAGNRGPWTDIAEINLLSLAATPNPTQGIWSPVIPFGLVPAAAAQLPNGNILAWSASQALSYTSLGAGRTVTTILNPSSGTVSQAIIYASNHEMFCPGTAMLADGRLMVAGGSNNKNTSFYDPVTQQWSAGPQMNIGRGYEAMTPLSDGRVFVLGGSWSGGIGGKNGEVWSAADGWTLLPGVSVTPIETADPQGEYRSDNHGWFFAWTGDRVFHAGPSKNMNWISVDGTGSITSAGTRADATDEMNGDAVMYDVGKILAVGGATAYSNVDATSAAYVIDINGSSPVVTKVGSMANARSFATGVVLPDGEVLVVGGQSHAVPFTDTTAILNPELWNPTTGKFTVMAPVAVPRTYHSIGLLLPDGRVLAAGGGMCGSCSTNHPDGQIFTPPYLLNPDGTLRERPTIMQAPSTLALGNDITVTTDRAVTGFSLVRMGAVTHTVDNDQRRIPLTIASSNANTYTLSAPSDPGIVLPGNYMLFALDSAGTPSVAAIINVPVPEPAP
jgi:galactose oxidase